MGRIHSGVDPLKGPLVLMISSAYESRCQPSHRIRPMFAGRGSDWCPRGGLTGFRLAGNARGVRIRALAPADPPKGAKRGDYHVLHGAWCCAGSLQKSRTLSILRTRPDARA